MLSSSSSTSSQQRSTPPRESKHDARGGAGSSTFPSQWRTPGQQHVYYRRLLAVLRSVSDRAGKDAADSALALTARGQSRWSRAILTGRPIKVALTAMVKKPAEKVKHAVAEPGEPSKKRMVNKKLRRLGRLVPGCGKLPAPSLLENEADYISALEMQVKVMSELDAMLRVGTTEGMGPRQVGGAGGGHDEGGGSGGHDEGGGSGGGGCRGGGHDEGGGGSGGGGCGGGGHDGGGGSGGGGGSKNDATSLFFDVEDYNRWRHHARGVKILLLSFFLSVRPGVSLSFRCQDSKAVGGTDLTLPTPC